MVTPSALTKPQPFDKAAEEQKTKAIEAARSKWTAANTAAIAAEQATSRARGALDAANRAAQQLADAGDIGAATQQEVEQARGDHQRHTARLTAFKAHREAHRLHEQITKNAAVVAVLAVDGLRLRKLRKAVELFNEQLLELSTVAKWGRVELSADLSVVYDGKPLVLLSASEQYRARVTVQVALAKLDKSAVVVADAADILDKGGRNGLMRLALHMGSLESPVPTVICMTIFERDKLPKANPRARVYWMEGNEAHAVE